MSSVTSQPRFHVALNASSANFADTIAFYQSVFGQGPVKQKPGYAKFDLVQPSLNLTLNAVDQVQHGDLNHLGIQVWSDAELDAARLRLQSTGLMLEEEPQVEEAHPIPAEISAFADFGLHSVPDSAIVTPRESTPAAHKVFQTVMAHLATELLQRETGVKLTHIPYKGASQGLTDVLSGQVQLYVSSVPTLIGVRKLSHGRTH